MVEAVQKAVSVDFSRAGVSDELCRRFEEGETPHPTIASSVAERSAFEACARQKEFMVESWVLGWRPFTEDCSVFLSEEARSKCRQTVDEAPNYMSLAGELTLLITTFVVGMLLLRGSVRFIGLQDGPGNLDCFGGPLFGGKRTEEYLFQ